MSLASISTPSAHECVLDGNFERCSCCHGDHLESTWHDLLDLKMNSCAPLIGVDYKSLLRFNTKLSSNATATSKSSRSSPEKGQEEKKLSYLLFRSWIIYECWRVTLHPFQFSSLVAKSDMPAIKKGNVTLSAKRYDDINRNRSNRDFYWNSIFSHSCILEVDQRFWLHSTEVAFLLHTQQPWVRFLTF